MSRAVFWIALSACGRLGFEAATPDGAQVDAGPIANRVFVTSSSFPGDFGGRAVADAACRDRASSAGLDGTFIAFITAAAGNPVDPIERLRGSRGWVRLDGRPVYDTVDDLAAAGSIYPVLLDESGNAMSGCVFTGTNENGTLAVSTCSNWATASVSTTAAFGSPTATTWAAIRKGFITCNAQCAVYCFEIGRTVAVAKPTGVTGRILFATHGGWSGGSVQTADNLCNAEAAAANMTGTYRALLAMTGQTAAARLASLAGPWRRADGLVLTSGPLAAPLEISPNVGADGLPVPTSPGASQAWIGAASLTTPGSDADTCSNWSATAGYGVFGDITETGTTVFGDVQSRTLCGTQGFLYCAQDS
jgi:hypothetical protein